MRSQRKSAKPVEFVASKLCHEGRVRRAYIGLSGQNITLSRRSVVHHGLTAGGGVRVAEIVAGGAAAAAGLTSGDIVVALDGTPTPTVDDLHRLLTDERVGKPSTVSFLRLGEKREVVIFPAEAPPRV